MLAREVATMSTPLLGLLEPALGQSRDAENAPGQEAFGSLSYLWLLF